jgi:hypothetical protein
MELNRNNQCQDDLRRKVSKRYSQSFQLFLKVGGTKNLAESRTSSQILVGARPRPLIGNLGCISLILFSVSRLDIGYFYSIPFNRSHLYYLLPFQLNLFIYMEEK